MPDLSRFAENYAYHYTADHFGPLPPEILGGTKTAPVLAETGAFLQPNGDVRFRLYYPGVSEVRLEIGRSPRPAELRLERTADGFFEGVYPFPDDPSYRGRREMDIFADGIRVLDPRIPTIPGDRMKNCIDIPDPDWDDYLLKDVPHGTVSYELYRSEVYGETRRCMVYTPAEYRAHPEKRYGVVYLHHGGYGNEAQWFFAGKAPLILDNLFAEGRAEPFLVVANNNSPRFTADPTQRTEEYRRGMEDFCQCLLRDCIPFIEREYRVVPDKWHRCTAGLSYGCMVTSYTGFGHPEAFGNLGLISGGLRCKDFAPALADNHHIDWLRGGSARAAEEYRLIYRSHGTVEYHDSGDHAEDEAFLRENGILDLPNLVREWFPGGLHQWDTFGKGLAGLACHLFR